MTPEMAKLVVAALFALPGALALVAPGPARRALEAFPDNAICGKILSAAAFLWAAALIYFTPLDFIAKFRVFIAIFLVVSIPLSWRWMPWLLAARSLGALWCLIPAPVLVAVRFAPGGGRLVAVALMYLMATAGMVATFSPYYLRDAFSRLARGGAGPIRCVGAAMVILGVLAL